MSTPSPTKEAESRCLIVSVWSFLTQLPPPTLPPVAAQQSTFKRCIKHQVVKTTGRARAHLRDAVGDGLPLLRPAAHMVLPLAVLLGAGAALHLGVLAIGHPPPREQSA